MKQRWQALAARVDALSIRERVMIAAAAAALLWAAWDAALMAPLEAKRAARERETREIQGRLSQLTAAASVLAGQAPELVAPRREAEALEAEIVELDRELALASAGVIEPKEMARALEELLAKRTDLRLIELAALPPRSVQQEGIEREVAFRHGIVVVVEGPYLSTLRYLQAIEALPYRFAWESVELAAVEYPVNRTRIVLYTLGLQEDLLGG